MLPDTFLMNNELFMNYTVLICGASALLGFIAGRIPSEWFQKLKKPKQDHAEG